MDTLFDRSKQWLRENRDGPKAAKSRSATLAFPSGPRPDLVHFLVVTEEGSSIL